MTDKTQEELDKIFKNHPKLIIGLYRGEPILTPETIKLKQDFLAYINKNYVPKGDLEDQVVSNEAKLNQADKRCEVTENTSDGYHTFKELYEFRLLYNASLFNAWVEQRKFNVYKSRLHADGEYPFGKPDWFIVGAELPTGQITNHYEMKHWDLFVIPEVPRGTTWDGHTAQDVANRLRQWLEGNDMLVTNPETTTKANSDVPTFTLDEVEKIIGEDEPTPSMPEYSIENDIAWRDINFPYITNKLRAEQREKLKSIRREKR